jgi:predicted transcriptional regulator
MRKDKFKTRYLLQVEISLLSTLIITSLFFYFYPSIEQKFKSNNSIIEPDFIITYIPRTYQEIEKVKPPIPESPVFFEETELMEDEEIAKKEDVDSLIFKDSSEIALLYYEDLLPYPDLEKFDPNTLQTQIKPLDQYHEYLNNRLTEIFSERKSYKNRTYIDDVLAQSMGRDPGMLSVNIGSVIDATKKYINSNNKRNISVDSIIKSEKHWYILELLWEKKGQTIFEIYTDESIRKNNTVATLKESINNLKENGLVFEVEDFERSRYFPAHNPDEMIEIVNRLLAQDLPAQQKDILSSFVNFIILNS